MLVRNRKLDKTALVSGGVFRTLGELRFDLDQVNDVIRKLERVEARRCRFARAAIQSLRGEMKEIDRCSAVFRSLKHWEHNKNPRAIGSCHPKKESASGPLLVYERRRG